MESEKKLEAMDPATLIKARRFLESQMRWKLKTMEEVSLALNRMIAGNIKRIVIFRNGPLQEK